MLQDAAFEAGTFQNYLALKQETLSLERLKEKGITVIQPDACLRAQAAPGCIAAYGAEPASRPTAKSYPASATDPDGEPGAARSPAPLTVGELAA